MRIVKTTELDQEAFAHSRSMEVHDAGEGVVRLSFGPSSFRLSENAARDFLHDLAAYFAAKDLEEYPTEPDFELEESRAALLEICRLK